MHPENERVMDLLRLPDQEFFTFDEDAEDRILDDLIVMNEFEGTAIGAPRTVDVTVRKGLPLLWLRRESGLRSWQVEATRNSTVVVVDRSSGTIALWDAFRGPKMVNLAQVPSSAAGEPPPSEEAEGVTASVDLLDLKSIANLPFRPGRFAATLILHDWISNTVLIDLTGPESLPARIPGDQARAIDEQHRAAQAQSRPLCTLLGTDEVNWPGGSGLVLSDPTGEGQSLLRCGVRVPLAEGMCHVEPDRAAEKRKSRPGSGRRSC
jgi:hypothetical protein